MESCFFSQNFGRREEREKEKAGEWNRIKLCKMVTARDPGTVVGVSHQWHWDHLGVGEAAKLWAWVGQKESCFLLAPSLVAIAGLPFSQHLPCDYPAMCALLVLPLAEPTPSPGAVPFVFLSSFLLSPSLLCVLTLSYMLWFQQHFWGDGPQYSLTKNNINKMMVVQTDCRSKRVTQKYRQWLLVTAEEKQ